MSQVQSLSASPSLSLIAGRPATTSQEVARFFGKRHTHVLRDIENLMDNCPKSFTEPNFGLSEYTDETGRTLPMFNLFRDGFMLLVMGYTGKKALAVKLAYIDAFNRMEAQLAGKAIPQTTTPSTAESRKPLRALVHAWSQVTGVHHAALWPQVKAHFQLSRIDDLPEEWIPDALAWVQQKIDEAGRALPPAPEPRQLPVPVEGDKALQRLHSTREFCRFDFLPRAYRANDQTAARRFKLAEDLYKLQDCLWAALYNICSAAQRIRDEA